MAKVQLQAKLINKEQLKDDILKFSVEAKEIVDMAKPGQFLEIRVNDQVEPFLRRPISIYNMNKEKGILEFIFQVKGNGTEILAKKEVGSQIDIIGPLGYGTFKYEKYELLGFHTMGFFKYDNLKIENPLKEISALDKETLQKLQMILDKDE